MRSLLALTRGLRRHLLRKVNSIFDLFPVGGCVLSLMGGSGSMVESCMMLGRSGISVEIDSTSMFLSCFLVLGSQFPYVQKRLADVELAIDNKLDGVSDPKS